MKPVRSRLSLALLAFGCACTPYELPPSSGQKLPGRVSELGLYADLHAGTVVAEARPYRPAYALWSDGAEKRRWIRLPPGQTINTSDQDAWRFPVGTELWKEFSVGGKRIETRVLKKVGLDDGAWAAMTYAWNQEQTDAVAAPSGAIDALGTRYDIPSAGTCMACHGGRSSRVLGFSAVQLSHAPYGPDDFTLEKLASEQRLSSAPTKPIVVPGSREDSEAIGYLHANCSHCHNSVRPADATYFNPPRTIDFDLRLRDLAAVTSTSAYMTVARYTMGENPAENHLVIQRMTHEGAYMRRMPPLATEVADASGVALVTKFVERVSREHSTP